jgi:RNA polymerase sigma-70 factor (ECF subfamily)
MTDSIRDEEHIPDEELISKALGGNAEADGHLEHLLKRHRPSIYRRCLSITGDHHDAEDVTQEILVRVLRGLDGYQGRSSFRTWLHTIVQHQCWTFSAKRTRQSIPQEVRAKIELHLGAGSDSHSEPISDKQLPRMLAEMPVQVREILQLRYFRELPLPRIATLLGMSLSATKMRLYRALATGQDLMSTRAADMPSEQKLQARGGQQKLGSAFNARLYANRTEPPQIVERRHSA